MIVALPIFSLPLLASPSKDVSVPLTARYIQSGLAKKAVPVPTFPDRQQIVAQQKADAEAARIAAEAQAAQLAAESAKAAPAPSQQPTMAVSGSCGEWMAQAGITDIANATIIINHESGCNPHAVNASSGACGIGQALPCSKTGCSMDDPVCQLRWMQSYVFGRYGSWAGAVGFWNNHGWY